MKTDSQIQKDVIDELKWNPSVSDTHIGHQGPKRSRCRNECSQFTNGSHCRGK
jgi:hypothetical protein